MTEETKIVMEKKEDKDYISIKLTIKLLFFKTNNKNKDFFVLKQCF